MTGIDPSPALPAGPAALTWRVEPWRDSPRRAVTGFVAAAALAVLAVRLAPVPIAGWALAIALLVMLGPAYLPIECRVDDDGLGRRVGWGWERRAWGDIKRARLSNDGLYVSTLRHGGALEPFRGLLLPLPRGETHELKAALSEQLRAHGV